MASKGIELSVMPVLIMMMISNKASGQPGCTSTLIGLAPCLNYVTGNTTTPSSSCCSQLSSVVQSQPHCLCALVNGGGASSLGITINQTLALSLPSACNVQTPPVSQCNSANNGPAPASSPLSPPSDSGDDTPTPTTPAPNTVTPSLPGGGSKTVPTAGGTSAASITGMQLHYTLSIIFIASLASNLIRF